MVEGKVQVIKPQSINKKKQQRKSTQLNQKKNFPKKNPKKQLNQYQRQIV